MKKLLAIFLSILVLASFTLFAVGSSDDESADVSNNVETTSNTDQKSEADETTTETTTKDNTTMGQKNALKKAKNYLDFSAFSYKGLVKQLEYEGFTNEEAVYAVDNCGADWNEQAAKKAKSYLDFSAFSKQGLIDQLEYEGFTYEQAVYGAEANGY